MTEEEIAYANAVTLNPCETLREQIRRVSDSLARMEGEGGEESRNGVAIVLDLGGGRKHEGDGN